MIIVSQDKRMIINFDNVIGIVIRKNNEENVYQIQCKSGNEASKRILGKYETEERAKEVLQEIIKQYKNLITSYKKGRSDYPIETLFFDRNVYEMPKE